MGWDVTFAKIESYGEKAACFPGPSESGRESQVSPSAAFTLF